jgi:hypothetical protein
MCGCGFKNKKRIDKNFISSEDPLVLGTDPDPSVMKQKY